MNKQEKILIETEKGSLDFIEAIARNCARAGETADLGDARIDHGRLNRCGFPEFIYGESKSVDQLLRIIPELLGRNGEVLVTRVKEEAAQALTAAFPQGKFDSEARIFFIRRPGRELRGNVLIVSAGTSDRGVALEAKYTLEACGFASSLLEDVGVASIERVLAHVAELRQADLVIVIAGMEGALPSVIGGLVRAPVIAVPTPVGYGASFGGMSALLGMLNCCASGVTVVNIGNGFGAACAAARILNQFLK